MFTLVWFERSLDIMDVSRFVVCFNDSKGTIFQRALDKRSYPKKQPWSTLSIVNVCRLRSLGSEDVNDGHVT